ncbi:MAG TPA: UDP-glucose 6-dehydrogenase, partial [Candidatus Syntrophosphaera sp.]|nr:UDP-glucose 6-dehydrogenase [Candidatus Syntrophosphaera sp.]
MNLAVIGSGYVGLVTGACFAEMGNRVVCVDNDERKISMLNNYEIPIYEPGLKEMVERNSQSGRLSFTLDLAEAVRNSRIIFIAVGTPPEEDGSADLQYVLAVARDIARHMQ